MTDGSSRGFLLSATLHGIAAALLLFSFLTNRNADEMPKVFELVAGEGDNYMAREAPALGRPGGVTIELPATPEPQPEPPQAAPQEIIAPAPRPAPPEPKSVTPEPPKSPVTPPPDFKKKLKNDLKAAESKAKREIAKKRAAEVKREAEAKRAADAKREADAKKAAEDQKPTLTKAEFDRANKTKKSTTPGKSSPVKVAKIDAEGIAKGVVGGSTANKKGGAGGKALKAENDDVLAAYDAMFKQRLRTEFEPPPGLSDSLMVEIEVRSNADGSLSGGTVSKTSGSAEFDRAVLDALKRVRMPPRPDKKSETIAFFFTMRERLEN